MTSSFNGLDLGYAVAQVVKTLRYARVRFLMGLLEFFIDLITGVKCSLTFVKEMD